MTRVLAVLVDALRFDYVNQDNTPFIHQLAQQGRKLPLKPILGYSDAIRATIFTGTYPDRHGYWMSYCYSPETSPFKNLKWLSFIDYVPSDLVRRGIKFLLSSTVMKVLARVRGYASLHLHNMPFRTIDRFDMTLRQPMTAPGVFPSYPTIFDVLRNHGMKFAYFDSSKLKGRLLSQIAEVGKDTKLIFVYLHYVDEASHWFGLDSSKFKRSLAFVDGMVQQVVSAVKELGEEALSILVFSDHGMAEEKNRVDLSHLTKMGGFGKDFVLSLDATMIRVWYEQPNGTQAIKRLTPPAGDFRLLSEAERKDFGIAFKNRLYGDDIFLFDEGQIIFPNHYSYIRPKAMHAYDPKLSKQHGIFILANREGLTNGAEIVELIDIGPTILRVLGIPPPSTFEGKALSMTMPAARASWSPLN